MGRRAKRKASFPLRPRQQAALLLLAWCASLLLPLFHVDVEVGARAEARPETVGERGPTHDCAADRCGADDVPAIASHATVGAACGDGCGCPNPWHHSRSPSHHDDSQCPSCSSLLERISEIPVAFDLSPTRVDFVAPRSVRLPPPAERLVVALARGPPSSPRSG